MKILHTSDWHLGHMLYNYDRTEEHTSMLNQMIDIVKTHKPDLFLLSGDIYHTAQPSIAAQTMFVNALVNIHAAHPDMEIVVTAGNHDSGSRHEIFQNAWKLFNVHAIGTLDAEDLNGHIIEIAGKGYVIAIPYAHERNIPEGFFQTILDEVAKRNTESLPVVMSAHTTVKGCDFAGHESRPRFGAKDSEDCTIGGIDAFEVKQLGEGYDYLALGHIHHQQFIHTGKHNVRYSGSPMAVSFDESYPHSVSIVEIDAHGSTPEVTQVEIANIKPLVSLPKSGFASWDEAIKLLSEFPDDIPAYIRLNVVNDKTYPTDANAQAIKLVENKACQFCHINLQREKAKAGEYKALTVQEFKEISPLEIAERYASDSGKEFDDELKELFNEALEMLNKEQNND